MAEPLLNDVLRVDGHDLGAVLAPAVEGLRVVLDGATADDQLVTKVAVRVLDVLKDVPERGERLCPLVLVVDPTMGIAVRGALSERLLVRAEAVDVRPAVIEVVRQA